MLLEEARANSPPPVPNIGGSATPTTGASNPFDDQFAFTYDPDLEEKALQRACARLTARRGLQADVPEDCLRDAARELAISQEVAIIQHESDAMQVAHHYFENAIAYFTRVLTSHHDGMRERRDRSVCGHNAFLRWSAMKEAAFVDKDGQKKYWSEEHVSEDFDMAMRVQLRGYIVRWATYSNKGFKEGVSLSADDELNRWSCAGGPSIRTVAMNCCSTQSIRGRGKDRLRRRSDGSCGRVPRFTTRSRSTVRCSLPALFGADYSLDGIASALSMGVLNYILLGMQFHIDNFYMRGFELWLACFVLFLGAGNISFTIMEYRLGNRSIVSRVVVSIMMC
ncbi:CAZyme family GT [Salix suchowensis]|nr:CAZyme family GT [Salix suchowensis]